MQIGSQIRAAREARRLTQDELARQLGVSMMTVSRWERDAATPSVSRLHEIAAMLDVTVGSLLDDGQAVA